MDLCQRAIQASLQWPAPARHKGIVLNNPRDSGFAFANQRAEHV